MMLSILSVLAASALVLVGALRRRAPSLALDLALVTIAAWVAALSMASTTTSVRIGYLLLGLFVAAVATRSLVRSRAAETSRPA